MSVFKTEGFFLKAGLRQEHGGGRPLHGLCELGWYFGFRTRSFILKNNLSKIKCSSRPIKSSKLMSLTRWIKKNRLNSLLGRKIAEARWWVAKIA